MSDKYIIKSSEPFYDIPDISVAQLVLQLIEKLDGKSTCFVDSNTDSQITIEELISKSKSIAMALIDRGLTKTDIILTFSENTKELVILLFAAMFVGSTIYPISPSVNYYELEQLFATLDSIVIFTSQSKSEIIGKTIKEKKFNNIKFVGILDGYEDFVSFSELLKEGQNKSLRKIPFFRLKSNEDIFMLFQSSGTSGLPKSVMISQRSFVSNILSIVKGNWNSLATSGQPSLCLMSPVACVSGMLSLIGYISVGAKVVTFHEYNPELILQSIEKYKTSVVSFVPAFIHKLICGDLVDKYDFSSVKIMLTVGAAVPAHICRDIIKLYSVSIIEVYGMSEFGALTQVSGLDYIPGNLGPPGHNTEIKVIDLNTGHSLGPNIDGEICARSNKLFSGYLNNPEATKEAIDEEGWLHTGDIGHYDQQNRIFITDRLKELIKVGTKQVSPTELEQFLLTHESVAEVAVVGVKHETQTQWPRAYVKCAENSCVSEKKIQEFVADALGVAKQLRAGVVFVDQIRRTTVGKIDRRFYKQLVANEVIKSERKLSKYEIGFKFD